MATVSTSRRRLSWPSRIACAAAFAAAIGFGAARAQDEATDEPITPVPPAPPADPARLALGDTLFHDARLSGNGKYSCASCHDTETNGADGRAHDLAPDGRTIELTTITVFNASLSFRLNWQGDARSLEEQAEMALSRSDIMASTPEHAVAVLQTDSAMVRRFKQIYGHGPDQASLFDAIATYERSLVTPDSRFDQYLKGAKDAINAEEKAGYALFKSLGCVACHQGVNIGGNLYERQGIFSPLASRTPEVLRVPSLRNIAVTAPYFHDGSMPSLKGAVSAMIRGQLGRDPSQDQVEKIVVFLDTLTGRYHGRLLSQPR
jgi:cytochrome c peroxidase